jgi:hypothetical protein
MTIHQKNLQPGPGTVTTGPIRGSRKVYAAVAAIPTMQVPFREIALTDPNERRCASMIPPVPIPRPTRASTCEGPAEVRARLDRRARLGARLPPRR